MKRSHSFLTNLALAAVIASPTAAVAQNPRSFLQNALEGDNSEVMLGQLAADRATSPQVKEYGRMLSADHSQAREEVIRVGAKVGIRRNRDVAPEAKNERDKLRQLDGRDFDREFIRYMIQDHQKDVADFSDEARANDGLASSLASEQLPTLQKHLEMAKDLDRGGHRDQMNSDQRRLMEHDRRGDRPQDRSDDRNR